MTHAAESGPDGPRDFELEAACWELLRAMSGMGFGRTRAHRERWENALDGFCEVLFRRPERDRQVLTPGGVYIPTKDAPEEAVA